MHEPELHSTAATVVVERRAAGSRARVMEHLQSRHGGLWLAALALVLTLPALRLGLLTDDNFFIQEVRSGSGPFDLFRFRLDFTSAREVGVFSWWSDPLLSLHFLRPLSSLTHFIEGRYWPSAAWLMHLTNGVLYAALVAVVWALYRELAPEPPRLAALAALLFAVDDAHGPAVGWIASRNTLLANGFGLCALLLHVRARRRRSIGLQVGSAACLALGLFSAEAGVAGLAYLIAYAWVFEPGSPLRRAASLAPALTVFLVWLAVYIAGGHGAHHLGLYRDLARPVSLLVEGVCDLPLWILSLLGPSLVGTTVLLPAAAARIGALVLVLPLVAAMWHALPRTPLTRFFLLGALLCLPPLFTTVPQDRLVLSASFGALGLVASVLSDVGARERRLTRLTLIGVHLVLAPLLFVAALGQNRPIDLGWRALAAAATSSNARDVVSVNLPTELLTLYAVPFCSQMHGGGRFSLHQLYAGGSAFSLSRTGARTLELSVDDGWARTPMEHSFVATENLPRVGETRAFPSLQATVLESTSDGRPARVRFEFPTPLESPERAWLAWQGQTAVPWTPPPVGQSVRFDAVSMFRSLPR